MENIKQIKVYGLLWLLVAFGFVMNANANDLSVYTQKPHDPEAFFFTPEKYAIKGDGKMDISNALQSAINELKRTKNFGILFIPEGKYLLSKTIHVPAAIRLIGYGKKRPEFILGKKTPGYQHKQNYMIWFTNGLVEEGGAPVDAGAGTFYSALSNIDFRIESGNPEAVAIRSHFAQHSFISHSILNIGNGKAGIYDVGNEMENVKFYGGQYGISSSRTSPGWPMMMVDTYFEGQKKAAIQTREAGLTIINMYAKNIPVVVEMQEGRVDKLFIENSFFENVSQAGILVSKENNAFSQVNLINVDCNNVPQLVKYRQSGKKETVTQKQYKVKEFTYGLVMADMTSPSSFQTIRVIEPLAVFPKKMTMDILPLPSMTTWVNIRDLGAKGDGETDDTQVFQNAIAMHKNIYVPQGWYRLTKTLKMASGTKLIGLHPFGTQFVLNESETAFSGFGTPQAVVESSEGGDDIINGIGISTGAYNYRAVGLKWMASKNSMINDVKFVGGHGTMKKPAQVTNTTNAPGAPQGGGGQGGRFNANASRVSSPSNPVSAQGLDLAWDNQYWSLWVTNNGGGTIKDVWTANTYAASGFYVSHTSTPGRVYAMSLEHHVRNEARFENVSNWKLYAFQFEEEGREGKDNIMLEVSNSKDLMFANLWMYRVIRASAPKQFGIRLWNSEHIDFRNMHNYTQILPVIEIPVYDVNKQIPVYEWDFARLLVTGKEQGNSLFSNRPGVIEQVVSGFEFAAGATSDSKGNVYFGENRLKKIYKWSAETKSLSLIADYPWKPFTMSTDTKDNLLVVFRYDPQPGYLVDGKQETVARVPDDNPMYSGWGNSGWTALAYSIDPTNPDASMQPMIRMQTDQVKGVKRVIHPSSRWRGDFNKTVESMPAYSFVAPDGVTIIPETYDLGRSAALTSVTPGQSEPVYIAREIDKVTVKLDVAADGRLINLKESQPQGQYSNVVDSDGNLYIADGQIYVYNKDGKEVKRIMLKERPISITIGDTDKNTLFITTTTSLYKMKIK
ncbi:SMP-30/Gluconolaconase/LRE-like region-containing protein [Pedobacter sp. ok626]|uniref:glycosyl hydrolase family 28-related protein n=1 Tax=Pedobacter sp. ok626 TaxID=1761882 RepID=UPI00087EAADA|nr:glycosyl hydrolase family 28-related protein [Pedobacter sp. ok626]SDK73360.1 SMP-30/Gluconolaconase/LRE-like region-containing protein [Pedobacter sp. ok626]